MTEDRGDRIRIPENTLLLIMIEIIDLEVIKAARITTIAFDTATEVAGMAGISTAVHCRRLFSVLYLKLYTNNSIRVYRTIRSYMRTVLECGAPKYQPELSLCLVFYISQHWYSYDSVTY